MHLEELCIVLEVAVRQHLLPPLVVLGDHKTAEDGADVLQQHRQDSISTRNAGTGGDLRMHLVMQGSARICLRLAGLPCRTLICACTRAFLLLQLRMSTLSVYSDTDSAACR